MEKAAGKKAPQPTPSKNLKIPRINGVSENVITKPDKAVRSIPNLITFRFPILSARIPRGTRARKAPIKYPEKIREGFYEKDAVSGRCSGNDGSSHTMCFGSSEVAGI